MKRNGLYIISLFIIAALVLVVPSLGILYSFLLSLSFILFQHSTKNVSVSVVANHGRYAYTNDFIYTDVITTIQLPK